MGGRKMRIEIVGKNGYVPTKAVEDYVRKD